MQQVTSHIPLVNQFFSDLAGFSGFFSRSPTQTPENKHSKMELPHLYCEHCVWAQRWHHPVFWNHQGSLSLPLWGKLEGLWGYRRMTLSFFLKLFHCIMPRVDILFSQLQKWTIDSDSLSPGESCGSSHSFSDFSVHDWILAVAGNGIIKGRLPQQNVLHEQAPTAACPARACSSLVAALILQCFSWYSKALYIITSKTEQHIKSRLKKKKRHHILKAVEEVGFGQWGEHGQVWPH